MGSSAKLRKGIRIAVRTMQQHHDGVVGSSVIRGNWLLNYFEEAESFKEGEEYDVVIYQKVIDVDDMKSMRGIQILDLCDPMWREQPNELKEVLPYMTAVTVLTPKLGAELRQFGYKGDMFVIPDRVDPGWTTLKKKKHNKEVTY